MTTRTQFEEDTIEYPDSDGQPMAENTLQYEWIVTVKGNLDALLPDDFVAGDLFWYPVKGRPDIRLAPDVMVALGRPKGHRSSYMQWRENDQPPDVVFEIWSPGNRQAEVEGKFAFYQQYGVSEYYTYDPDTGLLLGWERSGNQFQPIAQMNGWTSPRLGIRFDDSGDELAICRPDGSRFLSFAENFAALTAGQQRLAQERQEKDRVEQRAERERREHAYTKKWVDQERRERELAEQQAAIDRQMRELAEQQVGVERERRELTEQRVALEREGRELAEQRSEEDRQARAEIYQRAERLAIRLRALGIDPDEPPSAS